VGANRRIAGAKHSAEGTKDTVAGPETPPHRPSRTTPSDAETPRAASPPLMRLG
jgi:hypothetical protein